MRAPSGFGGIDHVWDVTHERRFAAGTPVRAGGDSLMALTGWAVEPDGCARTAGVYAIVAGQRLRGLYGFPRPDVSAHLGSEAFRNSGFRIYVAPGVLAAGAHDVRLLLLGLEGRMHEIGRSTIVVEDAVALPTDDQLRVAEHWDRLHDHEPGAPKVRDWMELPYLQREYINPQISGSGEVSWVDYITASYGAADAQRVLDIGCGTGHIEQRLVALGASFVQAVGFDLSAKGIEAARQTALEHGYAERVDYRCADFVGAEFPDAAFDLVIASGILHHVGELELLFEKIRRWKTPGGYFAVYEYIGPNRFQWSEATIREGNRLLQMLPDRLRIHGVSGEIIEQIWQPSAEAMIAGDPSEAIRASEIMALLASSFEIVERRDYGGTILLPLLADIAHNFDPDAREEDARLLQRLCDEERRLIEEGTLAPNFTFAVVR